MAMNIPQPGIDSVRERRQQIAKYALIANRVGYLLYAIAMAVFVMAFAFGFTQPMVTVITACMVVGSILLAPSIVLTHAVRATENEESGKGYR
ncbi:MAG: hypothetical protein EBU84_17360 [Actinobacteria bacterium]|jgi:hypothetical protein|nr:hypothetical protein [Actinomycetota bacterium]